MKNRIVSLGLAILLAALVNGCGGYNTDNSVDSDYTRYGPSEAGLSGAQLRFAQALKIIRTHCTECHATYASQSESDFTSRVTIEDGDYLAVAGDLDASAIWRVLRGGGIANYMPPEYSLSGAEIQTVRDWILNIGQP